MVKWTKEQCEKRFVEGDKITLSALSRISGVSLSTLKNWSKTGKWATRRSEYKPEPGAIAGQGSLADLEITHATAYATLRECAMAKANALKARIEMVAAQTKILPGIAIESLGAEATQSERQAQAQAQGEAIRDSDVLDLQALTNVVDKCIRGERMVLGAEYEDLNKAVAAIVRAGLEVKAPNGKVFAKLTTGEASEVG